MSAVKSLAFGVLVTVVLVRSAPAGSMLSTPSPRQNRGRAAMTPTSLVYASAAPVPSVTPNATHEVGAQNLAPTGNNPTSNTYGYDQASSQQGSTSGLFLGVTGGSVGTNAGPGNHSVNLSPTSLGVVSNGSSPTNSSPSPAPAPAPQSSPPSTPRAADAFINFGTAPYAEASSLTTGNAQAFTNSPVFTHLFGVNGPTSGDITKFENEVVSTIQSTYNNAGLSINLTTDPNARAAHMMSVVSGASYTGTAGAIGITDVGNNGFAFIDKFGGVQTPDQLAIAIGHNLSHELMHAFGIANHPEQTGPYVDAATSTLQTLSDPSTSFSPAASSLLSTLNFQDVGQSVTTGAQRIDGNQILVADAATVPEPSTIALWALAGGLVVTYRRRQAA